jgi:hypothetical protein
VGEGDEDGEAWSEKLTDAAWEGVVTVGGGFVEVGVGREAEEEKMAVEMKAAETEKEADALKMAVGG